MASGFIQCTEGTVISTDQQAQRVAVTSAEVDFNDLYWGGSAQETGIELTTHTTTGTSIGFPTGGVRWSHLEIILRDTQTSGVPIHAALHECKIFLSWDAAGDDICAGPSSESGPMLTRQTTNNGGSQGATSTITTADFMVTMVLDVVTVLPPDGTIDKLYLWISTKNFVIVNPTVVRARLYWHELSKG